MFHFKPTDELLQSNTQDKSSSFQPNSFYIFQRRRSRKRAEQRKEKESNASFDVNHYIQFFVVVFLHKATQALTGGSMYLCSSKPTITKQAHLLECVRIQLVCACAGSTKALVSCNSNKPRLQAQVTLLY